ncbi:SbcC/MukB-like Walker B domain-containing protein [Reinekea marina]|uniref:ATP-binding protein n=1 Tax=Reinekea marina TaxID=1310421 RepID=A0ABV7WM02_9GAMM|nr:SbcC/MukB-like Walker B domain-containing protein [Reinekea marina]MDN3649918.1 SbcC/MukB-like Walker B domain-containing protein [Reinekea marina]
MHLKKFIYVNWGNIPVMEFDFGPINLFSGGNGSGKTTAADALQTIMTAAHDTLFQYNPGQDEATQRGRGKQVRTLASYVLGCDDGSFARLDPTVGYLAAVFHPTQGESAEPFTAIIGVSAFLDKAGATPIARQSDIAYFISAGESLSKSDFVQENDGRSQVISLDKIVSRLSSRKVSVEKYDTKKQYLRRLYAALKGRSDAISEREAMNAARAFSRFMAYKPVKSIDGFVAQEILEKKDLGEAIRTVSDLMKTINGMENEANRLKSIIDRLAQARSAGESYVDRWIDYNVTDYIAAKSRYVADQQRYLAVKSEQQKVINSHEALINDLDVATERRRQTHDQLVSIEAQRRGVEALQDKDRFETKVKEATEKLQKQAEPLLRQNIALEKTLTASNSLHQLLLKSSLATEIEGLGDKRLHQLAKQVAQQSKLEIDFQSLLNQDWIDISPLEAHLDAALSQQSLLNEWRQLWFDEQMQGSGVSLRDQAQRLVDRREQRLLQTRQSISRKQQDIDSLASAQVNYPHHVRIALEAIKRECPEADPRVLCDYVEILDEQWQSSLEGYMAGARFAILVEPDYEAEAISIVRALPRDNRARVIQGSKAKQDAQRIKLPSNSIVHLLKFDHAIAKSYLTASYGMVEQCKDAQELKKTRRGVTPAGLGSGAYAMYRCDLPISDLVFGQGARERALDAKKNELNELAKQANELQAGVDEIRSLYNAVNQLTHMQHGQFMRDMLETHRELRNAEQALTSLDLSDVQGIEEEYKQVSTALAELDKKISDGNEQKGKLQERIAGLTKQCCYLSEQQEDTQLRSEEKEEYLRNIVEFWPNFDVDARLKSADEQAADTDADREENLRKSLESELTAKAHELEVLLKEHNQECQQQDAIEIDMDYGQLHSLDFFRGMVNLRRAIDNGLNRMRNNVLVEKVDQLASLRESFNSAFVTNLCHAIYHSINEGKRVLQNLNKELEHHRFGADREKYWFDYQWVPEFKEYWHFFDEVFKSPSIGEGNTLFDTKLTERSSKIRDQLMTMLLDVDEQRALRELERISDYRNYRSYEIYKQPEGKQPIALSQYGTGSGGQLETPAYIIRSAAITSAFRFNEGDSHLRMVLVDEAFSKMDETRSKEVIRYLTESLGLQLLFIMPTSKSGPFMDMISNQFVFSKVPLTNASARGELNTRVLVDRQQCNQEKIQELWANHRKVIRKQAELDFLEGL